MYILLFLLVQNFNSRVKLTCLTTERYGTLQKILNKSQQISEVAYLFNSFLIEKERCAGAVALL